MAVEGQSFDGAAGLGRNDEQGMGRVNGLGDGCDLTGDGGVQQSEPGVVFRQGAIADKRAAEDFRAQAAAAHSEQHDVAVAFGADFVDEGREVRQMGAQEAARIEPTQPVCDFPRGRAPDGMVAFPQALRHMLPDQAVKGLPRYVRHRLRGGVHTYPPLTSLRASSTTRAAVKPNRSSATAPGADAPKVDIPIDAPSSPTYLAQPPVAPASTDSRDR